MPTGSTADPHERAEHRAYARGYVEGLQDASAFDGEDSVAAAENARRAPTEPPSVPRLIVRETDRVVFDPDDPYWADVPVVRVVDAGDGFGRLEPVRGHIDPTAFAAAGYASTSLNFFPGDVFGWLINPDFGQYAQLVLPGERPLDLRYGFEVDLWRTLLARGERISAPVYRRRLRQHERHIRQVIETGYELVGTGHSNAYFAKTGDGTWTRW